jgi:hypothetical protein
MLPQDSQLWYLSGNAEGLKEGKDRHNVRTKKTSSYSFEVVELCYILYRI